MAEGRDEGPGWWGRVVKVRVAGCVGEEVCVAWGGGVSGWVVELVGGRGEVPCREA